MSSQKTLGNYPVLSTSKYTVYYCTVNNTIFILAGFYFCIRNNESHIYKYYTRLAASTMQRETLIDCLGISLSLPKTTEIMGFVVFT